MYAFCLGSCVTKFREMKLLKERQIATSSFSSCRVLILLFWHPYTQALHLSQALWTLRKWHMGVGSPALLVGDWAQGHESFALGLGRGAKFGKRLECEFKIRISLFKKMYYNSKSYVVWKGRFLKKSLLRHQQDHTKCISPQSPFNPVSNIHA